MRSWFAGLGLICALLAASNAVAAATAPIALVVDVRDAPGTSIVHVHETIPATPGTFDLAYPRWVPGEHGPNGPIENLTALHLSANQHDLAWTRDLADLNEFHVVVPTGANAIVADFDVLGGRTAAYSDVRLATATMLAVNWNQFLLYPAAGDIAALTVKAVLVVPGPDWIAQSALPGAVRAGNDISYAAATLERLVDSPVDAGTVFKRFMLLDADGFTCEIDAFADRPSQLELAPKTLDGLRAMIPEVDAIYGVRHWRDYHFLLTVSDVMPGNGIEHGSSSDDGDDGDSLTDPDGVATVSEILAHELNHSWNGKYRRPADLATANYQVPERTDLLWIYEGMTQLYGQLVATRAGLWTQQRFRETLARSYARQDREPGRRTRPLADTTTSAPFLYQVSHDFGSARRGAGDFYDEGELLWLDVDARIDALSHGTKSLDGFCKQFFGIANTPPEVNPYTYAQFLDALRAYAPYDWASYFQARVYRVTAHPPDPFESLGWKLVYSDVPNESEAARLAKDHRVDVFFSLGIGIDKKGTLYDVAEGSPAARGGLGFGDTLVAVNGREYDGDVLLDEVKAAQATKQPLSLIVKRNGLYRTVSVDYHGGQRYPHLVRIPGTPDRLTSLTAPRRSR